MKAHTLRAKGEETMRVALFGGTGFIGSAVARRLVEAGNTPVLLVRSGSERKLSGIPSACKTVPGDIDDDDAVRATLDGCEAAVYAIGILREFPRRGITFENIHYHGAVRAIDQARHAGVRRFLLLSANGVRNEGVPYQTTKFRAEEYLRASGLAWTIVRPSIVFGDPGEGMEFCMMIRNTIIRYPLPAPLFFTGFSIRRAGAFMFSPVHVDDVAAVVAGAVASDAAAGRLYNLGGPVTLDWRTLINTIAAASGAKKYLLPVPLTPVKIIASLLERFPWFPATRDQLTMLAEGNVCDGSPAFGEYGIEAMRIDEKNLNYLGR